MTSITLERKVGRLLFPNPLVVGAGVCKTLADVKKAVNSAAAGVELGTITPPPLAGNAGDNFYAHRVKGVLIYTLNSLGMPNPGKDDVTTWAKEAISYAHAKGKLIGVNVAADTVEDIVMMVSWAVELGFDWVTINAGCPNKFVDGVPQSILSFDIEGTNELMHQLSRVVGNCGTEVWWKPSPPNNILGLQAQSWAMVEACPTITGMVVNNTVSHCFSFDGDSDRQAIPFGSGHAGMGGPAVKPKALGDVKRLAAQFPELNVSGSGGVVEGRDIFDYLLVDARIVHCTSAIWANNLDMRVLGLILSDFCEVAGIEF